MKIALIHNFYQQAGGEDAVFYAEKELLLKKGHAVAPFCVQNSSIARFSEKIRTAIHTPYSESARRKVSSFLRQTHPDIVHVHNFFPLLTPSIYDACMEHKTPVVQTLHNYRTVCAAAILLRKGTICETCTRRSPYTAVIHRCYRGSLMGSLAVARMIALHRHLKTWQTKVDQFIALTEFAKHKFSEAGFPTHKITVKPNFQYAPELRCSPGSPREGALFVGRLSPEKGVMTLVNAWRNLDFPLRIAGDGPLFKTIKAMETPNVVLLGHLSHEEVSQQMASSRFLVLPSECYEGFPMVVVEAYSHGLPVLATRLGGLAEIVENTITGLHFQYKDAVDLVDKARWMNRHPDQCRAMGEHARKVFESKYSADTNYALLLAIYTKTLGRTNC